MGRLERLRAGLGRRLGRLSPTVLLGIALLAAGVVTSILQATSAGAPGSASLEETLSSAIHLAQRAILWGEDTVDDAQPRFNAIVLAVILEGLTPAQERALASVAAIAGHAAADLFSLGGLGTLAALLAGYVALARVFDQRFPDARRRSRPTSGARPSA